MDRPDEVTYNVKVGTLYKTEVGVDYPVEIEITTSASAAACGVYLQVEGEYLLDLYRYVVDKSLKKLWARNTHVCMRLLMVVAVVHLYDVVFALEHIPYGVTLLSWVWLDWRCAGNVLCSLHLPGSIFFFVRRTFGQGGFCSHLRAS